MKIKLIALLLAMLTMLQLASCGKIHYHNGNIPKPLDPSQDGGTGGADTDGEENTDNNSEENQEGNENDGTEIPEGALVYVYSVNSKVLHREDCYHVERMNEDYKKTFVGDLAELIEREFELCKSCFKPPKVEEDTEEPEDNTNKIPIEEATYLINTNSLKLHCLDCYHVESMSDKNIEYTNLTLEELIALDEYIPCGTCLPDEAEEYKEKHGITDETD
ncbi:MAG: hypothetical protein IJX97_01770 [Clostridia bacterium]|nr:hypothetical protein [Clostridia bacterium]